MHLTVKVEKKTFAFLLSRILIMNAMNEILSTILWHSCHLHIECNVADKNCGSRTNSTPNSEERKQSLCVTLLKGKKNISTLLWKIARIAIIFLLSKICPKWNGAHPSNKIFLPRPSLEKESYQKQIHNFIWSLGLILYGADGKRPNATEQFFSVCGSSNDASHEFTWKEYEKRDYDDNALWLEGGSCRSLKKDF